MGWHRRTLEIKARACDDLHQCVAADPKRAVGGDAGALQKEHSLMWMFREWGTLIVLLLIVAFAVLRSPRRRRGPPNVNHIAPTYTRSSNTYTSSSNRQNAEVVYVIDGDTVDVRVSGRKTRVRLDAIDCPENGQHWGDTAKFGLVKLIGGKTVHLEQHGQDQYGRTIATIYVSHANGSKWINVNERMVTLGHAWVMRKYYSHLSKERQRQLNRLEAWAKSKRVGLWGTPNPIPPWEWRRET